MNKELSILSLAIMEEVGGFEGIKTLNEALLEMSKDDKTNKNCLYRRVQNRLWNWFDKKEF